jgi:very-short-patch-repair endonuclease
MSPDCATLTHRARKLRREATPAERKLWNALSTVRPRFTRQLSLSPFIADFACRRARLLVELDGSQHAESITDPGRTARLKRRGWVVLRYWNNDVLENLEGVVRAILETGNTRLPPGEAYEFIPSRAGRERKPRTRAPK